MTKADAHFYLLLGEDMLGNAAAQSQIIRHFLKRFETLQTFISTQHKVYTMPDGFEKDQALAGLGEAAETVGKLDSRELLDFLARGETRREQIEAFLNNIQKDIEK